ncbi:MAG TPA: hypothetical protein VFL69_00400 [Marmoricola sp.]|nr:hypothetical protein [Marmoricola sp.]
MTTKSDFSEEQWARVIRAPLIAGMAITLADPGGPIEAAKESMASIRSATNPPSHEQLLTEVALDLQAQVQQHHNPIKGYRPTGDTPPGEQILQELRDVQTLIKEHATPEEATAFGTWLVDSAQAAATAAKEGGFMGFHAEQVSDREKAMIARVRDAVAG